MKAPWVCLIPTKRGLPAPGRRMTPLRAKVASMPPFWALCAYVSAGRPSPVEFRCGTRPPVPPAPWAVQVGQLGVHFDQLNKEFRLLNLGARFLCPGPRRDGAIPLEHRRPWVPSEDARLDRPPRPTMIPNTKFEYLTSQFKTCPSLHASSAPNQNPNSAAGPTQPD